MSIARTNPFSIRWHSIDPQLSTVIAVNWGRWPIAVVKSSSLPVSYGLSCALPFVISYDAVCERSDESWRAASVFHIDGNDFKICREVEAVRTFNLFQTEGLHWNVNTTKLIEKQTSRHATFTWPKSNSHFFITDPYRSYLITSQEHPISHCHFRGIFHWRRSMPDHPQKSSLPFLLTSHTNITLHSLPSLYYTELMYTTVLLVAKVFLTLMQRLARWTKGSDVFMLWHATAFHVKWNFKGIEWTTHRGRENLSISTSSVRTPPPSPAFPARNNNLLPKKLSRTLHFSSKKTSMYALLPYTST